MFKFLINSSILLAMSNLSATTSVVHSIRLRQPIDTSKEIALLEGHKKKHSIYNKAGNTSKKQSFLKKKSNHKKVSPKSSMTEQDAEDIIGTCPGLKNNIDEKVIRQNLLFENEIENADQDSNSVDADEESYRFTEDGLDYSDEQALE